MIYDDVASNQSVIAPLPFSLGIAINNELYQNVRPTVVNKVNKVHVKHFLLPRVMLINNQNMEIVGISSLTARDLEELQQKFAILQ